MGMMMMQSRAASEQREHQSRIDAEQRDREYQLRLIDAEQRDREYQLRREEMAIAREDACAQRQLMNVMMMAMLNRNGGGGSTQPPPGSPMNDSFPQQPNE
jgi:Tfp pilus assembly protein PilX